MWERREREREREIDRSIQLFKKGYIVFWSFQYNGTALCIEGKKERQGKSEKEKLKVFPLFIYYCMMGFRVKRVDWEEGKNKSRMM